MHSENRFELVVKLPLQEAAPLFGAEKERVWAPGWNPKFLWPAKPNDQPGMVFSVMHEQHAAVWINTAYDLANGFFQYAYVIPDVVATLITLKLTPHDGGTRVAVKYERTALSAAAEERVLQMAVQDGNSGPEWQAQIEDYLSKLPQ